MKVDFAFIDGRFGWKETHWLIGPIAIDAAMTKAVALATLRSKLYQASSLVTLTTVTCSADDVLGDSLVQVVNLPGNKKLTGNPDVPWNTVKYRAEGGAAGVNHATRYLSGVPDAIVVDGALNFSEPNFSQAFNDYRDALCGPINVDTGLRPGNTGWGFLANVLDLTVNPKLHITGILTNGTTATISTSVAGFQTGDKIRVGKTKGFGPPNFDGTYVVTVGATPPQTQCVVLSDAAAGNFNFAIDFAGYAQKQTPAIMNYTSIQSMGFARCKRGAGPGSPKGKKKKKKK